MTRQTLDRLQNADIKRGSTEVLSRLNPYSGLRPDSRLILVNPSPFYYKKMRKVVIHFEFAPLTGE
jgi:hypothetical protein